MQPTHTQTELIYFQFINDDTVAIQVVKCAANERVNNVHDKKMVHAFNSPSSNVGQFIPYIQSILRGWAHKQQIVFQTNRKSLWTFPDSLTSFSYSQ